MIDSLIYLDNNATTPTDPRVVEAMLPFFYEMPGNAASRTHPFGWIAKDAVDQARVHIAELLEIETREIVFTSGATEAINLAIKGAFEAYHRKGQHVITVKTEHKAVLDTCKKIEKLGGEVTYLDVDEAGLLDLEQLKASIRPTTVLISVMWANNETGVLQPIKEIGAICAEEGILFCCDATQAVGKVVVKPKEMGIHLLAFSGHKFYGPKGVGGLFVSRRNPRVRINALIEGGGHEDGMRSGTLNVPGIVGLGKAAKLAYGEMLDEAKRLIKWRNQLEKKLLSELEEVFVNGNEEKRLGHVTNMTFSFAEAERLMKTFNQEIALSSGSACTSASLEPSHVLMAMGRTTNNAKASLRFSFGRFNKEEEVEKVADAIIKGVHELRAQNPIWDMFKEGIDLP